GIVDRRAGSARRQPRVAVGCRSGPGCSGRTSRTHLRPLLSHRRGPLARDRRRRTWSGDCEMGGRSQRRPDRARRHGFGSDIPDHLAHNEECELMMIQVVLQLILLTTMLQPSAPANPAVVFVCEHGAAKSVIATAYFNKLAAERGLPFRATFRGTSPQENLSVRAVEGLKADGLAIPTGKPSAISDSDVAGATHIFAIGCTLPEKARASGKAGDWSDVP